MSFTTPAVSQKDMTFTIDTTDDPDWQNHPLNNYLSHIRSPGGHWPGSLMTLARRHMANPVFFSPSNSSIRLST